jgi:RimJ/RimL family protein N-acetyltransferase
MPKQVIHPIEKGRIRLRLLERSDLPMTLRWRNQDHIRKWFIHSEVISPQGHQEWFEKYLKRDDDYLFIVEEIHIFNKPIGQVSIYEIKWNERKAKFGRLLIDEPETQGKGLAKMAASILLNYGSNTLGINRYELEALSSNESALALYRSLGFIEISDVNGIKKMVRISDK